MNKLKKEAGRRTTIPASTKSGSDRITDRITDRKKKAFKKSKKKNHLKNDSK